MHRSSDLTDEPSRFKQFAWEQWENQPFAVLFRPGTYGLDRYVVKRYIEQVLGQCERWRQLTPYFCNISPTPRAYTITSYEVELMQRILDFHLNNTLHLRITTTADQLIEYDDLLDFIRRAQDLSRSNSNTQQNSVRSIPGKKGAVPSIPSIHSSYVLPPSAKSMMPSLPPPTTSKISPVKPALTKPPAPALPPAIPSQPNKTSNPTTLLNGHNTTQSSTDSSSRLASNAQIKPNLISPPGVQSTYSNPPPSSLSSSNPSSPVIPPELCPNTLYNSRIEGSGWVQINNVFLPFIIKLRQRLVPYQVLISCKILEADELRATVTRATLADSALMNSMIRECKINNEEILENALLINVYHVLVGTKNLVYVKILPKDNPTSKINRQYKSVLALRGGSLYITYRTVPFVCSSNHSYIPLNDVLSIYPYLQAQLKPLARVPRTHELDFLQLVQMYHEEKELPSDTLLIDMEDLNQTQIIPSKNMTLIEHQAREKSKLEQKIILLNNAASSATNKRKNSESHDNKQTQPKSKQSTVSNHFTQSSNPMPAHIRPPTGYFPAQQTPQSSSSFTPQYQQNHWLSSNYGQQGRTRWQ